ncbi:MAG TPA: alpha/beta fold hydrolase [Thermomicrobiales bacterium]
MSDYRRDKRAAPWQRLNGYDALVRMAEVAVDGRRVFYRFAGEERAGALPLVLIHGLGVSSAYWGRLLPWLADHRPVYALDLPGFGQSDDPDNILNSVQLAQATRRWMETLGLDCVHVLAHSQGAQVAIELADDCPHHVASLILASPTLGERDPPLPWMALRLLRDAPREDRTILPVVTRAYFRSGLVPMVWTNHLLSHDDSVETLGHLQLPILLVRGEYDPVVTAEAIRLLAHAAPHAHRAVITAAPHGFHWSHAFQLARLVNDFLATLDTPPAP